MYCGNFSSKKWHFPFGFSCLVDKFCRKCTLSIWFRRLFKVEKWPLQQKMSSGFFSLEKNDTFHWVSSTFLIWKMTPGWKKLLWKNIVENYHFGFVDFVKLKSDPWNEKKVCRFFCRKITLSIWFRRLFQVEKWSLEGKDVLGKNLSKNGTFHLISSTFSSWKVIPGAKKNVLWPKKYRKKTHSATAGGDESEVVIDMPVPAVSLHRTDRRALLTMSAGSAEQD